MRNVQIIIIGSEVINGFILDKNSQFFANELFLLGYRIHKIHTIPDDKDLILSTIQEIQKTKDLIITSGGLGPTEDDLTVDILCNLLQCEAIHNEYAVNKAKAIFTTKPNINQELALKQTRIPQKAEPLKNEIGLAPGIWIPEIPLIALPGFPVEIKSIWKYAVEKINTLDLHKKYSEIIPIWGIGESSLFSKLKIPHNIEYGVHALPYGCRLFLSSVHQNELINIKEKIYNDYKAHIIENPLKEVIDILKQQQKTIGTIESCTGGLAGKLITDIEGVSSIYKGTIVSYHNDVKQNLVNVSENSLINEGAVSQQVAFEMAKNGATKLDVDICISYTGIAGPTGGTDKKPVGTVFVCIYNSKNNTHLDFNFFLPMGRERFREATVYLSFLKLWQNLYL